MAKRSTKMGEKKVHSKKCSPLKKILATCLMDKLFYGRISQVWNNLPSEVFHKTDSLNSFKNSIDSHWNNLPLKFDFRANIPTRTNELEAPWNSIS